MAEANSTRRLAGSSLSAQSDEFGALFRRLLVSISHVRLVTQHFGDFTSLRPEDASAGLTLHQAAADLDRLYNELDVWYIGHEHFRKFGEFSPACASELSEGQQRFREALSRHREVGTLLGEIVPDALEQEDISRALDNAETHLSDAVGVLRKARDVFPTGRFGTFTGDDTARTPLTGLPPAHPCPFCGRHDDVMVSQIQADDHEQGPWFRANCGNCGVDALGDDTALGAAQQWNRRGIDPTTESADEKSVALGASDETADRIRAFLMSVRPLRGASHVADLDEYQCGRVTIERMANASHDTDEPEIVVTLSEAADVLKFLTWVEPFEPDHWWKDPENAPSHVCGLGFVLRTLERSLRSKEAQL